MCVVPAGKIGNCTCGMPKLLPHAGKKSSLRHPSSTRAKPSDPSSSSCLSAGREGCGVLKVEQLHALARDIYYGRRGRINARELHEQMNSCSCLTLLLACVVYWQAKEISRVLKLGIPEGEDIDISLLEHVSPIEWENVILYGPYVLNPGDIP